MTDQRSLQAAFLEDHRHLTGGLEKLRTAVSDNDPARAAMIARDLDEKAGPHIAFEEDVLYPALRRVLGDAFVDRLYDEHAEGQHAVRTVLRCAARKRFTDTEVEDLKRGLTVALDHALSCGTLLSHVDRFDAGDRAVLLDALVRLRGSGRRWTSLQPPKPAVGRG